MAEVTVGLDAELVVDVMVLAGVGSPQDVVELVARDGALREVDGKPQERQGCDGVGPVQLFSTATAACLVTPPSRTVPLDLSGQGAPEGYDGVTG